MKNSKPDLTVWPAGHNNGNTGSVLLLTMMIMVLVSVMALGVLTLTSNSLFMTTRQRMGGEAFNLAETAAEMGACWLRNQSIAPSRSDAFTPDGYGNVTLGSGTWTTVITPDASNTTVFLKTFKVTGVGVVGSVTRKVEIIVKQATFGRFAYFTDKETSSVSGGAIWWKAGEVCDGPAHSNNTNGSNFQINYNGSTTSIFKDIVTAAGTTINYSPSKPGNEATFQKVFKDGSKGYRLGVQRIELPPSTDAQKKAAWGTDVGYPTTTGVYLRANAAGGIYIVGNSTMVLGVDGSGNQTFTIVQGANTTTITVNLAAKTMSATGTVGSGSPTSCAAMPNGVIYSTGDITSLKGTIADNRYTGSTITTRSAWTIATDVNNNKDITVTDNIKYKTRPNKTLAADNAVNVAAGTLGLVAHDVDISSSAPANVEIDGVLLAGGQNTADGSFSAVNYDSRTPVGTLTVLGGIIQKARGAVGTFNSGTGQTQTGYTKSYSYDPRLATDPPPYYPTTGTYDRLSWRTVPYPTAGG